MLDQLYQEVILDHYQTPRNHGVMKDADVTFELINPTCGDVVQMQLKWDEAGCVETVMFSGEGCTISQSSASMLTVLLQGKTVDEVRHSIQEFYSMVQGQEGKYESLGELQALVGVRHFPTRVNCALLAWKALEKGLNGKGSGLHEKQGGNS